MFRLVLPIIALLVSILFVACATEPVPTPEMFGATYADTFELPDDKKAKDESQKVVVPDYEPARYYATDISADTQTAEEEEREQERKEAAAKIQPTANVPKPEFVDPNMAPKTAPKKAAPKKRVPAKAAVASGPFKPGMNQFKKGCEMKEQPDGASKKVGWVKAGKKLWVDNHDANWAKVYKKSGAAYVSKGCL